MTSPKKKTVTVKSEIHMRQSFADQFLDQREKTDLQIDLKKAELAVENLSQTLIAVNQKFVVQNDLKTDVQTHQQMTQESEQFRDQLHEQIRAITDKNKESAQRYQARQEELMGDNTAQAQEIQRQREEAAATLKAHQDQCAQLNRDHAATREAKNQEIDALKKQHTDDRQAWEVANQNREAHHQDELAARAATLKKREDEHATYTTDMNARHDAATQAARSAHNQEMKARLDEMHANDRKFRDDLDAADREKQRLIQEHHNKLQQRETYIDTINKAHQQQVQALNESHAADTRRNQDTHNAEIRAKNEEINTRNNQYLAERDAWYRERTQIEERHQNEIRQKNDLIDKNNREHLQKVESLEQQHAQYVARLTDMFNSQIRAKDDHMDECNKRHISEKDAWLADKTAMESKFNQDLAARDANLAAREREHEQKIDQLVATHDAAVRALRDDHAAAMAARLAENAANQAKFDADLAALQKQMSEQAQRHLDELARVNAAHHAQVTQLNASYAKLQAEFEAKVQELTTQMEQQRSSYEIQINKLELTIKELRLTIQTHETTIDGLNNELNIRKDVEEQLRMGRDHEAQMFAAKAELQKELDTAAEYINELEAKYLKAQETSIELLKHLKNAEFEIETLKQYIIDLKSRIAVYIPMKGDLVDKRLAEYINNFPDRQKLKIMFMRESEGIYQFGTKRVSVKVEKDKINIRVGGGYLSIDEFLDQYTPVELEKLERKDPLKRFNEKIAVQKTIAGKEVRENSPVRGSQVSPRKGSPSKVAI